MRALKGFFLGLGILSMIISVVFLLPGLQENYNDFQDRMEGSDPEFADLSSDEKLAEFEVSHALERETSISVFIVFLLIGIGLIAAVLGLTILSYYEKKTKMLQEFSKYKNFKDYDLEYKITKKRELSSINTNTVNHISSMVSDAAPRLDNKSMYILADMIKDYLKNETEE